MADRLGRRRQRKQAGEGEHREEDKAGHEGEGGGEGCGRTRPGGRVPSVIRQQYSIKYRFCQVYKWVLN